MLRTDLDIKVQGHYRVRVWGDDFIKNETDVVRIWFDTDTGRDSPDFSFQWIMGRNPAQSVGRTHIKRIDGWRSADHPRLRCPGMKHQVNYARDVITVLVPRKCLGDHKELKWAGQVAWINRYDESSDRIYGPWDLSPGFLSFPPWRVRVALGAHLPVSVHTPGDQGLAWAPLPPP